MFNLKQLYNFLLGLILLLSMSSFAEQLAQKNTAICSEKPIRIAWHNYYPFSFRDNQTGAPLGRDISLVIQICDTMGCAYQFVHMTWGRTLLEVEKNAIDMSMYAYKTPDRMKRFKFSSPYRTESVRIAILEKNRNQWDIRSLNDLAHYDMTVAVDAHVWAGEEFNALTFHPF